MLQLSVLKSTHSWRARFTGMFWLCCTLWWCKASVNLN